MKLEHLSGAFLLTLALAAPLYAQGAAAAAPQSPMPAGKKSLVSKVSGIFTSPLHPVVKSVAPSGGLGFGVGYDVPSDGRWSTTVEAVGTVRRYWSAGVTSAYQGDRTLFEGYARMREMCQLTFFGSGTDSTLVERTSFLYRDPVIGARASFRVTPWMALGGRVEQIWPGIGTGERPSVPSIEARFDDVGAPGLIQQPGFGRYQGIVEIEAPAAAGQGFNQGGQYRVTYGRYNDQQFDRFSFNRLDLEARHRFAVFGAHRRLTLHGWMVTTDPGAGHDVPFFFQPTLGRNSQVGSVHEELIGTDGSRAGLRGFENFRFRDRHLLLLQAEYRIPVWGPIDATVFVDAGKVTSQFDELSLSGLKRNYGFSLNVMRGPSTLVRTDIGFGGGEGVKVLFHVGFGGGDEDFLP